MTEPDRTHPGPDDLAAISALLTGPPPALEVAEAARQRLAQVSRGRATIPRPRPGPARWTARARRGPRWLAPAGAAVAVAAVIGASLIIARTEMPGSPSQGPGAIAGVPKFFVSISYNAHSSSAVVSATATGKVLGTVAPPRPARVFSMVAAAGDGRDFVLAASRGILVNKVPSEGPTRFYRLVLSPSGQPARLTRLPITVQTRALSGLALSADGRQLAVSLYPRGNRRNGGTIQIFSLATGAERDWTWPGPGCVCGYQNNGIPTEYDARSMSWTADGRRLLFQVQQGFGDLQVSQVRLLDTASPGGDLRAASTVIPIPAADLDNTARQAPINIDGPMLITGDGTLVVGAAHRRLAPSSAIRHNSIAEFSVRTGKLVRVLGEQEIAYFIETGLLWVNQDGTVAIISRPRPRQAASLVSQSVLGVQTLTGFTALPAPIQQRYRLQPDW